MDIKRKPIKPNSTKTMQDGTSGPKSSGRSADEILRQEINMAGLFEMINTQADWQSVRMRIVKDGSNTQTRRLWTPFMRIAAALVLTMGVAAALYVVQTPADHEAQNGLTTQTAVQLPLEVTLPDGSVVTLKKGASLSYASEFGKKFRDVNLTGEALFDVRHDASLPFRVLTGTSIVLVTGTRFMVRQEDGNVKVSVLSGTVLLSNTKVPEKQISISANQSGFLRVAAGMDKQLSVEDGIEVNELSWKTGHLVFRETPIDSALMDVAHHFSRELILDAPIGDEITAEFQDQNLSEILDELGIVAGLKFDTTGNVLLVRQ
jgi:ferric-dicitrate binding protein FerR (iron transport regulator)